MERMIIMILLFSLFACNSESKKQTTADSDASTDAQKVILFDLNGNRINLDSYQGKTIFLNFWATWCKPCLQEMPSIAKAQELLAKEEVVFLFASDETTEQIRQFKNGHDFNFNYVRIDNVPELNIMGLPTTSIYNPEGKLIFSEMGFRKWDEKQNLDLIVNAKKL